MTMVQERARTREQTSLQKYMPYITIAVLVGGWLVQYGMDKASHAQLEATVKKLQAKDAVWNEINYSEHPRWASSIVSAEVGH
jgi:hypothetical protein